MNFIECFCAYSCAGEPALLFMVIFDESSGKMQKPNSLTLEGIYMSLMLSQYSKQVLPRRSRPSLSVTSLRLLQRQKVLNGRYFTPLPTTAFSSLKHRQNRPSPIVVTLSGITASFSLAQLQKAKLFISVTLSGILTDSAKSQRPKAYLPIRVSGLLLL